MQFILFRNFTGFFALFSLNPRDVFPYFLWREHAPYTGNEPRQLSREFRIVVGGTCEIQQFFSDQVIKCRFEPIPQLDVLGSVALLNPNLVHFSNAHSLPLVSIMMPHNRFTAESRLDSVTQAPTVAQTAARPAAIHSAGISGGFQAALR